MSMAVGVDMSSVKSISETRNLASIPSDYVFDDSHQNQIPTADDLTIPVIDFSLLTNPTHQQRSKAIDELRKACLNWGIFMVVNHGVDEILMKKMMDCSREFFDLSEEEKRKYETKHVLDPIRYGTSFNQQKEKVHFWRDYLKIMVHPNFHSPSNPSSFREVSEEYCSKILEMTRELLRGISESLGLEATNLEKSVNFESSSQILALNLYPRCPQPHLAMGLPPHSDHCLLTVLLQNEIAGLEILHDHNWVKVHPLQNSFIVNTADQLEILSNGKYKSVLHRAIVNEKATRLSIAIAVGPSLDTIVAPSPQLLHKHNNPPLFKGIKYKDFLETMQSQNLHEKSILDTIRNYS